MTIEISDREFNTILGALRHYQGDGLYMQGNRNAYIDAIVGDDGLSDLEIDRLCERINCDDVGE